MENYQEEKKGQSKPSEKESGLLSREEAKILSLVAVGKTNEEIASRLNVSHNTVENHLNSIFKKINAPNRLQAALWAAKNLKIL